MILILIATELRMILNLIRIWLCLQGQATQGNLNSLDETARKQLVQIENDVL